MNGLNMRFVAEVRRVLDEVISHESKVIEKVGALIGESIIKGQVTHIFGSGHSDLIARDVHQRAGGLACINRIYDPTVGFAERVTGFGDALISLYELQKDEVIIVISNSGRNPSPIEVALSAKDKGLKVVAITSLNHSRNVSSRHPSGKNLYQVADYVIDNHGVKGDAAVEISASGERMGATSTIIGSIIVNMIMIGAAEYCASKRFEAPVIVSQNLDGTDEQNSSLWMRYRNRLGPII